MSSLKAHIYRCMDVLVGLLVYHAEKAVCNLLHISQNVGVLLYEYNQ